jgi:hypothetical protein
VMRVEGYAGLFSGHLFLQSNIIYAEFGLYIITPSVDKVKRLCLLPFLIKHVISNQ